MEILTAEGIITQMVNYRDHDSIITLFTPSEGLLKLFVKGAFSKKKKGDFLSPLCLVEVAYVKGKGDLHTCSSANTIGHHLDLRKDFATLNASLQLLQTIIVTQQPGKASPELYQLLMTYIQKLPVALNPFAVTASFRLKTLRYEGLFYSSSRCSCCQSPIHERYFNEGETLCSLHAPPEALFFSEEESLIIDLLLLSRDFQQIASCECDEKLGIKIEKLFQSIV